MIRSILQSGVLLLLLFSCKSAQVVLDTPSAVEYELLCTDALYGAGEEGIEMGEITVRNKEELDACVDKMTSINAAICRDDLESFSFDDHMFVFVFDKVRSNESYALEFGTITENIDTIFISIDFIVNHGSFAEVLNQPYGVLLLPQSNKKVKLLTP